MDTKLPLVAAACLAIALPAAAQSDDDPAEALRGPEVSARAKRALVHFNMTGDLQPVEGRPEAAAALLLDLDEATNQRVREVIDERDAAVAMLLVEQIELVGRLSDAILANENDRAREMQIELWDHLDEDHTRSPLLESLGEVLSEADHAEVVRLTDEYWEALLDWRTRNQRTDDPERVKQLRTQTEERLAFQLFQREVRVGYEATLRRYRDAMEGIYQAVEPTDEQRTQMREILLEHIRSTQLRATPEQRRASTRRMYDLLDEERRAKFFDYLLRQIVPDAE